MEEEEKREILPKINEMNIIKETKENAIQNCCILIHNQIHLLLQLFILLLLAHSFVHCLLLPPFPAPYRSLLPILLSPLDTNYLPANQSSAPS